MCGSLLGWGWGLVDKVYFERIGPEPKAVSWDELELGQWFVEELSQKTLKCKTSETGMVVFSENKWSLVTDCPSSLQVGMFYPVRIEVIQAVLGG